MGLVMMKNKQKAPYHSSKSCLLVYKEVFCYVQKSMFLLIKQLSPDQIELQGKVQTIEYCLLLLINKFTYNFKSVQ